MGSLLGKKKSNPSVVGLNARAVAVGGLLSSQCRSTSHPVWDGSPYPPHQASWIPWRWKAQHDTWAIVAFSGLCSCLFSFSLLSSSLVLLSLSKVPTNAHLLVHILLLLHRPPTPTHSSPPHHITSPSSSSVYILHGHKHQNYPQEERTWEALRVLFKSWAHRTLPGLLYIFVFCCHFEKSVCVFWVSGDGFLLSEFFKEVLTTCSKLFFLCSLSLIDSGDEVANFCSEFWEIWAFVEYGRIVRFLERWVFLVNVVIWQNFWHIFQEMGFCCGRELFCDMEIERIFVRFSERWGSGVEEELFVIWNLAISCSSSSGCFGRKFGPRLTWRRHISSVSGNEICKKSGIHVWGLHFRLFFCIGQQQ